MVVVEGLLVREAAPLVLVISRSSLITPLQCRIRFRQGRRGEEARLGGCGAIELAEAVQRVAICDGHARIDGRISREA